MDYIKYMRFTLHSRDRIQERVGAEKELAFVSFVNHNPGHCMEIFRGTLKEKTRKKVTKKHGEKVSVIHSAKSDVHVLVKFDDAYYVLIISEDTNTVITVLGEKEYRHKSWSVNLSPLIQKYEDDRNPEGAAPSFGTREEVGLRFKPRSLQEGEALIKYRGTAYKISFPRLEEYIWAYRANNPADLIRGICKTMRGILENTEEDVVVVLFSRESFLKKANLFFI